MSSERVRILVEVPTKDRDAVLGRWLAAMSVQSYQEWDLVIYNDGREEVGRTQTTEYLLNHIRNQHQVWVEDGSHISQAHNHNMALYDKRFRHYRYIVRCDDDLLPNRQALERFVEVMEADRQRREGKRKRRARKMPTIVNQLLDDDAPLGAVGGLWFDVGDRAERLSDTLGDRLLCPDPPQDNPSCTGLVGTINSNWQQRMYHPTGDLFEVEHIYSMCIYDAEAMRRAGGWPEVYSRGVAHGEETDGTYRLYSSGYRLLIDPRVTGNHLRASGGIRSTKDLGQTQSVDLMKWQNRLSNLSKIPWQPTVAIECRHCYGLGGAERQFYHTVSLLQSRSGLDVVHPIFPSKHFSPDECEAAFGFRYEEPVDRLDEYDVLVVMGHEPTHGTRARHKILYTFFPIECDRASLREFSVIIGNSKYTASHVEEFWRYKAHHIYPPVVPIGAPEKKEDIILVVSRCVPHKSPLWLMERFVEWGFPRRGYQMHVVSATSVEAFDEYEKDVIRYAEQQPDIHLHRNVTNAELHDMFRRSKVMWGATGMLSQAPQAAEHFGYTPVEAWSAGCVPIMYDRGGHQETTNANLRWKTEEDLKQITDLVLDTMEALPGEGGLVRLGRKHEWRKGELPGIKSKGTFAIASFNESIFVPEEGVPYEWPEDETIPGTMTDGTFFIVPVDLSISDPDEYAWIWEQYVRRVNAMCFELQRVDEVLVEKRPIRVAMVSDSPYLPELGIGLTTGFGVVAGQIVRRMVDERDIDLSIYGLMDQQFPYTSKPLPFNFRPAIGDPEARHTLLNFIQWANPDVIFMIHAPGELLGWVDQYRSVGVPIPTIVYFPIEGARRLNGAVPDLVKKVDYPVTYCNNGAALIAPHVDKQIYVAYHGADHADFAPMEPKKRDHLRMLVDWQDKFVVGTMGTNKRVKNFPVMIDAMRVLLERGYGDIYFYFHTKAFDHHVMQGHHLVNLMQLDEEATGLPIREHIYLPMDYDKFHGWPYTSESMGLWRLTRPPSPQMRGALFSGLTLVQRLCMLHLYVDPSSAEGHGLPTLEAVACGVPTVSVDDEMARSEIHSRYCHMMQPSWWDTWHTGTKLAMVTPEQVADTILQLRGDEEEMARLASYHQQVKDDLPWEPTAQIFIDLVRKAYAAVN